LPSPPLPQRTSGEPAPYSSHCPRSSSHFIQSRVYILAHHLGITPLTVPTRRFCGVSTALSYPCST
jgi:hypothetical protein